MLPLRCPGKAGAPGVDDLPQSSIDGEGEGPLHEAASRRLGDHGSRELLEDGLEVGASESQMVHRQGD